MQTTDAEKLLVAALPQMWEDLVLKSKNVDASLIVVKKKFTEITQHQIKDFGKELGTFEERFHMEGPGAVGKDLDKGMDMKYRALGKFRGEGGG